MADSTFQRLWQDRLTTAALALSAILILAAASNGLWLDEIWSLAFAQNLGSALDVFTLRHDNNHPLNTLYLYLLGDGRPLLAYRLLSVAAGILCVWLCARAARELWTEAEALLSTVLIGTCFPLLVYFSEARGYSLALMFSMLAYASWRRRLGGGGRASLGLFWLASVLGLLSHATFIIATAALAIGHLGYLRDKQGNIRQVAARAIELHAVPATFAMAWYLYFLRNLEIGGGAPSDGWAVIAPASAMLLGFPDKPALQLAALFLYLASGILGISSMRRQGSPQWAFFLGVLFIAPAALLLFTIEDDFYFRYLLICFPFALLLLSRNLVSGFRQFGAAVRILVLSLVLVILAGQLQRDYVLLKLGRGQFSSTVEHLVQGSRETGWTVGSDHDFRNPMVLRFYAGRVPGGHRLRYVERGRWAASPPAWFLIHSQSISYRPMQHFTLPGAGEYYLDGSFPFSGLSGWTWHVYRRSATTEK